MTSLKLTRGVVAVPLLLLGLAFAAAEVRVAPAEEAATPATSDQNLESAAPRTAPATPDLRDTTGSTVVERPPVHDETVGMGSSVDRAPRDIREPFDE